MEFIFWIAFALVFYAYFGYPILLGILGRVIPFPGRADSDATLPGLTLLIPVHNEENVIADKISNTLALDYPAELLDILFVSDGSTDETNRIITEQAGDNIELLVVDKRQGKANALNRGLEAARRDIIVFSDASIMLDSQALRSIAKPFADPAIGCVSGEDHIEEMGGEGAYGRYELWIRNLESRFFSVVGASGSFYAQRKIACRPFEEGLAPDFLSVMNAADMGYRAVSEPSAFGSMTSASSSADEFHRKVRTLVRGMAVLFSRAGMMNPLAHGRFAFILISHKLVRWLVPLGLAGLFLSNPLLLDQAFFRLTMFGQVGFYLLAIAAWFETMGLNRTLPGKIALYFSLVNLGILVAWIRYLRGVRQEIWTPTIRN